VSYLHLSVYEPILAIWVAEAPAQVLQLFHEAARTELLARRAAGAPPRRDVFVHTIKLPISDAIGDLRQSHLNALVLVAGVVTQVGPVLSLVKSVKYDCLHCGFVVGPLLQRAEAARAPTACPQRRPVFGGGGGCTVCTAGSSS
jgi:DNA replication licensing factor MCM2